MKEKIDITLNQEDVQNIINCYEKDIELIEKLKEKNEIYKSTMKGQHRRIEELKQAKKVSKQIQKERNKRLRKENDRLWKQKLEYIDRIDKAIERLNTLIEFWKKYNPIDNTMQVEQFKGVIDILGGKNE